MVDPVAARLRISRLSQPLARNVLDSLRSNLETCPDLAFAHLTEVVAADQPRTRVLFVWLRPEALGSLRSALDLVAGGVARSLPDGEFVDVVILNSAPELLLDVEAAGCLLVETDAAERERAVAAAHAGAATTPAVATRPWWWPLG